MLTMLIVMTLIAGIFIGVFGTVAYCVHDMQKQDEKKTRLTPPVMGKVPDNMFTFPEPK